MIQAADQGLEKIHAHVEDIARVSGHNQSAST